MTQRISILLIEDDVVDQMAVTSMVKTRKLPYRLEIAGSVADARRALQGRSFDVILCDHKLGDGTSFDLFDLFAGRLVIFATGSGDEETAARALQLGAQDYLIKDPDRHYIKVLPQRIELTLRQRNAERVLRTSEERFRQMAEHLDVVIWITDPTCEHVEYVSPAFERVWGWSCAELMADGRLWLEGIVPEHRDKVAAAFLSLATAGHIEQEYRIVRKDGESRMIRDRGFAVRDETGRVIRRVGIAEDVTERKRIEQERDDSRERFELAACGAADGIWDFNQAEGLTYVSERWCELLGYRREELPSPQEIAPWIFAQIHPDDLPEVNETARQHWEERKPYAVEFRCRIKGGEFRWFASRGQAAWNSQGQMRRFAGSLTDVHHRRLAMEAQRQSEARYRRAERGVNDGLWEWNLVTGKTYSSPRWLDLLGYAPGDLLDHIDTFSRLIHPDDKALLRAKTEEHLQTGAALDMEIRLRRKDGEYLWVRSRGEVERDADGKPFRMTGAITDISGRKRADAALETERDRLRQILDSLFGFVAVLSLDGVIVEINQTSLQLTGLSREDVLGRQFVEMGWFTPDVVARARAAIEAAGRGEIVRVDVAASFPTVGARVVDGVSSPLRDAKGRVVNIIAFGVDVTDRKLAEIKLVENERFTRASLDALSAHIAVLDGDGRILTTNRAWRLFGEQNGLAPDRGAEGANYLSVCDSGTEDGQKVGRLIRAAIAGESAEAMIEYPCHSPREERWFICRITRFQGEGVVRVVVAHENISGRKQAEVALRESELRLSEAQRIARLGSWDRNYFTNRLRWSDEIFRILELDRDRFSASYEVFLNVVHPEDRELVNAAYTTSVQKRQPYDIVHRLLLPGGRIKIVHELCETLYDPDGRPFRSLGTVQDVTERVRAEEETRQNEMRLRVALETADLAVFEMDLSLRYTWVHSPQFGYSPSQVLGRTDGELLGEDGIRIMAIKQQALKLKQRVRDEVCVRDDGKDKYFGLVVEPIRSAAGETIGLRGASLDITLRKQIERELQELNTQLETRVAERTNELMLANARLEGSARMKDEFLATMSHELRTPLNVILGMGEALLENSTGNLTPRQLKSLTTMSASGTHLLGIINDILDLSKIGSGTLTLEFEPVSVKDVSESSLALVLMSAMRKQIQVTFEPDGRITSLRADPKRLKQILVNLLSNAVKFTPEGGRIGLTVSAPEDEAVVRFTVWDTGIGIAVADSVGLFRPFTQIDSGLNRMQDGTGLGLALVAKLTELHGGSVALESEPAKGSRFIVTLPIGDSAEVVGVVGDSTALPAGRRNDPVVLLAEDNEANIESVGGYLADKGYRMHYALDGNAAVRQARELHPALILMDIQMPVMDGLTAIHEIRADAALKDIPIIAVTGLAMPGDRERCLAAGANDYLYKPVKLKALVERMEKLLKREP